MISFIANSDWIQFIFLIVASLPFFYSEKYPTAKVISVVMFLIFGIKLCDYLGYN